MEKGGSLASGQAKRHFCSSGLCGRIDAPIWVEEEQCWIGSLWSPPDRSYRTVSQIRQLVPGDYLHICLRRFTIASPNYEKLSRFGSFPALRHEWWRAVSSEANPHRGRELSFARILVRGVRVRQHRSLLFIPGAMVVTSRKNVPTFIEASRLCHHSRLATRSGATSMYHQTY
jgi:hypothetical protein